MSFLGMFTKPTVQPPSNQGGSLTQQSKSGGPANPNANPETQAANNKSKAPDSPLDKYQSVWQTKQTDSKDPKPKKKGVLPEVDPKQLKEAISKFQFSDGVDPELVKAALGGDASALLQVMNHSAQNAVLAATQISQGLVETGVRSGQLSMEDQLDDRLRKVQLRNTRPQNKALNHPAVLPMLEALKLQFAQSQPDLSPEEVQAAAEEYFLTVGKTVFDKSNPTPDQNKDTKNDHDWLKAVGLDDSQQQPTS